MLDILSRKPKKSQKKEWTLKDLLENTTRTSRGCMEWKWNKDRNGYGRLWYEGRAGYKTHRLSMKLAGYDIDGWIVCHKCDNPPCINPDHLFLGTISDNIRDAQSKGRFPIALPKPPARAYNKPAIHGSTAMYNHGCRCGACKMANRDKLRSYRAKQR